MAELHPTDQCDGWIDARVRTPPEGEVVMTKIDDENGVRNCARLKRQGRLWYFPDGSMYVYYTPTHWCPDDVPGVPAATWVCSNCKSENRDDYHRISCPGCGQMRPVTRPPSHE